MIIRCRSASIYIYIIYIYIYSFSFFNFIHYTIDLKMHIYGGKKKEIISSHAIYEIITFTNKLPPKIYTVPSPF